MIIQTNFNIGDTVFCIVANEIETRRNGQTTGKTFEYEILEAKIHRVSAFILEVDEKKDPKVIVSYGVHEPSAKSYYCLTEEMSVDQGMVFQSRNLAEEKYNKLTAK